MYLRSANDNRTKHDAIKPAIRLENKIRRRLSGLIKDPTSNGAVIFATALAINRNDNSAALRKSLTRIHDSATKRRISANETKPDGNRSRQK